MHLLQIFCWELLSYDREFHCVSTVFWVGVFSIFILIQVARCTHFVIAHFINIVCCGIVHHCSHTAHIHDDKLVTCYKVVNECYRDCNGNSSAHVQGRRQLDLISGLCNTTPTYMYNVLSSTRACALLIGSKVTSCQCHMVYLSATG